MAKRDRATGRRIPTAGNMLKGDAKYLDDESRSIIGDGATTTQLAVMFEMDTQDVINKMRGCTPKNFGRNGVALYSIAEAAGRLVKPTYNIEHRIRNMNHADLPPLLGKEFWNGQTARLNFEERVGNLWPTQHIIAEASLAFKSMRTSIVLIGDQIEQEVELSEVQRGIVTRLIDQMLGELRANLGKLAGGRTDVYLRLDGGHVDGDGAVPDAADHSDPNRGL